MMTVIIIWVNMFMQFQGKILIYYLLISIHDKSICRNCIKSVVNQIHKHQVIWFIMVELNTTCKITTPTSLNAFSFVFCFWLCSVIHIIRNLCWISTNYINNIYKLVWIDVRTWLVVEKLATLHVAKLDWILRAVKSNSVQFMDGSMWLDCYFFFNFVSSNIVELQLWCKVARINKGKVYRLGSESTKAIERQFYQDSTSSSVQVMREEIEQLKNKLLIVETERDEPCDKVFNNERQIQQNNKMLHLLMKKMYFQPP